MTNLNFPGVDIDTMLSIGDQKDVARQSRYMCFGQGYRLPNALYAPAAGSKFGIYEQKIVADEYWTYGHQFLLVNFFLTNSTSNAESDNTGEVLVEGVTMVFKDVSGTLRTVPLKFGGAPSYNLTAGDAAPFFWTDPLPYWVPPNAVIKLRTAHYASTTRPYLTVFGYSKTLGERVEVSNSSLAAKLTAGGISTAVPSGNDIYPFGVVGAVAQGWDGRPVVLALDTSIGTAQGESRFDRNAFNEVGHVGRGLSSKANGAQRIPNINWSVSGATLQGLRGINPGEGLYRRKQVIDALGLDEPPFTCVLSGLGTNDSTAVSTWITRFQTSWAAIKAAWPDTPLVQMTMLPRVTSSDAMQTLANQSPYTSGYAYPTGTWAILNEWINSVPVGIDRVIDHSDWWDNFPNGGTRGKMRVDVFNPWTGILQAAATAGSLSVSLDSIPPAGSVLAFVTDNPECQIYYGYTNNSAPFSCGLMNALASNHAAGGIVKTANSVDGSHPAKVLNEYVADNAWSKTKIKGLLP